MLVCYSALETIRTAFATFAPATSVQVTCTIWPVLRSRGAAFVGPTVKTVDSVHSKVSGAAPPETAPNCFTVDVTSTMEKYPDRSKAAEASPEVPEPELLGLGATRGLGTVGGEGLGLGMGEYPAPETCELCDAWEA